MPQPSLHQREPHRAIRVAAGPLAAVLMAAAGGLGAASVAGVAGAATGAHRHGAQDHHHRSKGSEVRVLSSKKYGKILATASGRTLYVLVNKSGKSLRCTGACTSVWPPLVAHGKAKGANGVETKLLGSIRSGHSRVVTYDHHALYLYSGDTSVGQVNGEGIPSFGGTWYVLGKNGKPIKATLTSSGGGSSGYGSGSSSGGSSSGSSGGGW